MTLFFDGPERDVVLGPAVGHVEIIRLGRIFGGQRVDLLDAGLDPGFFPGFPDRRLVRSGQDGDLLIRIPFPLGFLEDVGGGGADGFVCLSLSPRSTMVLIRWMNQRSIRVSSWMRSTDQPLARASATPKSRSSVGWRSSFSRLAKE